MGVPAIPAQPTSGNNSLMPSLFRTRFEKQAQTPRLQDLVVKDCYDNDGDDSDSETLCDGTSVRDRDEDELAWLLGAVMLRGHGPEAGSSRVAEASQPPMCIVRSSSSQSSSSSWALTSIPQICNRRPQYSKGSKSYLTCNLTCAAVLKSVGLCVVSISIFCNYPLSYFSPGMRDPASFFEWLNTLYDMWAHLHCNIDGLCRQATEVCCESLLNALQHEM